MIKLIIIILLFTLLLNYKKDDNEYFSFNKNILLYKNRRALIANICNFKNNVIQIYFNNQFNENIDGVNVSTINSNTISILKNKISQVNNNLQNLGIQFSYTNDYEDAGLIVTLSPDFKKNYGHYHTSGIKENSQI